MSDPTTRLLVLERPSSPDGSEFRSNAHISASGGLVRLDGSWAWRRGDYRWEMSRRSVHGLGHVRVGVNEGVDGRGWRAVLARNNHAYESDIRT